MERKVNVIEPTAVVLPNKRRVAAYARVSVDKDAMLKSLSAQVSYYSAYIQKRKDWLYCGVYSDEALTGTKDTRPEFQRLLTDCREGKIDLVITKSISRFARNTVILLETVRELKERGIEVYFERENIYSLSGDGELMLAILASYAQEESRSASENQKWRIRKQFKQGRPTSMVIFGYKLINGKLHVVPDEAEIVRMIFNDYLSGMGTNLITKKLTAMGVATKRGGNWNDSVIDKMLRCEKYMGDLLLQKTFSTDHLSKKQRKNQGELPMYYVEDAHEPIINRDTFEKVQAEMARRSTKRKPTKKTAEEYPFTSKIVCEQCGKHYRRKITGAGTKYGKVVWICSTYNRLGKAVCPAQQIPEDILYSVVGDTSFAQIRIPQANTLIIVQPDGSEITRHWESPSRSESWTDEMKEQTRQRALSERRRLK